MMKFRIANTFTDSLDRLTSEERKAAKTTAFDLLMDRVNTGMSMHKIDRVRDEYFWSIRVSDDIRIIIHKNDSSLLLCYVNHHDDAYEWARCRKLETHPRTGAAQFVEIREMVQDIVIPNYVSPGLSVEPKRLLFESISRDTLFSYGVPAEWVDYVKEADQDTYLKLIDHLPEEAAEALFKLSIGEIPQVRQETHTVSNPFTHPDAQRRFLIVDDKEGLEYAMEYPYQLLYDSIKQHFNESGVKVKGKHFKVNSNKHKEYMQATVGISGIHYEWRVTQGRDYPEWGGVPRLDVALHFEFDDERLNKLWLEWVESQIKPFTVDQDIEFCTDTFGKIWRAVMFRIPFGRQDIALEAALLMGTLIEGTWPSIQQLHETVQLQKK